MSSPRVLLEAYINADQENASAKVLIADVGRTLASRGRSRQQVAP
jgi:hypothetical protein